MNMNVTGALESHGDDLLSVNLLVNGLRIEGVDLRYTRGLILQKEKSRDEFFLYTLPSGNMVVFFLPLVLAIEVIASEGESSEIQKMRISAALKYIYEESLDYH